MSGGALESILGKLAGPLLKIATPLAAKVLPVLGLSAAMGGIDGAIQKKIHGSETTTLVMVQRSYCLVCKKIQIILAQKKLV